MSEYILVLFWLGVMVLISQCIETKSREIVLGTQVYRTNIKYAWFVFLPIIIMVGFRKNVGDSLLSS